MTRALAIIVSVVALGVAMAAWLGLHGDRGRAGPAPRIAPELTDPVERGAYLAIAGNCRGCHTVLGGAAYAGGRDIPTPFGKFRSPNLTPDARTGLGKWTGDDFWHALHEGRSRNGAPLYPTFPYTHYTKLTREDSDALFAYLKSLPAVEHENLPHDLKFPYDQRWTLVAWRALFFSPGGYEQDTGKDEAWNRGAYLVQGLSHCGACHQARNALGAVRSKDDPAGGVVLDWYAPALNVRTEAGVATWTQDDVVALLHTGVVPGASTAGPMAEVVFESLQHLHDDDLQAMATYLRAIPDKPAGMTTAAPDPAEYEKPLARGRRLYADRCADCHGAKGEGSGVAAPALAGNRAVTMASAVNPIRTVLYGGYAPGTGGNPRPFGMPPFHGAMTDQEMADVLTFVRASWGNRAGPVEDFEVKRERTGPLW